MLALERRRGNQNLSSGHMRSKGTAPVSNHSGLIFVEAKVGHSSHQVEAERGNLGVRKRC